jgi:hypothetical protein
MIVMIRLWLKILKKVGFLNAMIQSHVVVEIVDTYMKQSKRQAFAQLANTLKHILNS